MSNLLRKASIITTPTAYAEDYLYSVKPAIPFGDELIVNGNFNTDSNWTKQTGWSISGGKAVKVAGTAGALTQNTIPTGVIGRKYKISFDAVVTAGVANSTLYGGTTPIFSATGSYDFIITASTTTDFNFYAASNFAGTIDNVSVKEITDADFDFDRNSTGTRVNEDYLIEDVPYNLATYSEDFSDSAYIKFQASIAETTIQSPISGSYVESISNTNTGTTYSFISQNLLEPDRESNLTLSVYAKKGTYNRLGISSRASGNTFGALFDLDSGIVVDTSNGSAQILGSSIQSAGNDFYLCSVTLEKATQFNIHPVPNNISNAALLIGSLSYTETGNVNIFGAQAVKGTNLKPYLKTTDRLDIPRIDYTNGEPSILLEPQRTNLVTHSEALTTYWTLQGASLIADNTAVNPTGNTFANKLNSTNTSTFRSITRNESTAWDSKTLTMSCFAKKITNDYIFFYNIGSVSGINGLWFNISNGTIGTNGAAWSNAKIENYGNGWYRCSAKITFGTSDNYLYINNSDGDNNTSSTVGSQTYIWGTQIEEGSYATSYIPTSGSAVTRSADAANNAGNSDLISSTEGVLYGELSKPQLDNDAHLLIALINNGATTDQNTVTIGFDSDDDFFIRIKSSGSDVLKYNAATSYPNQFYKIAVKYKSGDSSMYIDGKQVASSTNTFAFANTLNEINFNFDNNNGLPFYGNCKSIMVFKEALSDEELACLTSANNNEIFLNYYNRMQYVNATTEAMGCAQKTYTI